MGNYRLIPLLNLNAKNLQQVNNLQIESMLSMEPVWDSLPLSSFAAPSFVLSHSPFQKKKISLIHHIHKVNKKKHMIILIVAEKKFDKIQHMLMI